MTVEQVLEQIGLTKQEAILYVMTLKLGTAKASDIAQKASIQRGGAYYTLKLLKEKGYISEVIKSGVNYYSAVSPERIIELIDEENKRKKEIVASSLKDIKDLQRTAIEKPTIEVYEGYEGFKTIFSKLLEHPSQQFRAYLSDSILEYLPHFHEQFRKRRTEKRIFIKTITEDTKKLRDIQKIDKKENRETRFFSKLFKHENVLFYILEDAIVIINANKHEQQAIYIKEPNIVELQKNIFETIWKQSKK